VNARHMVSHPGRQLWEMSEQRQTRHTREPV